MLMKLLTSIIVFVLYLIPSESFAQGGYHFGLKGGPTLANQNWDGFERRYALTYNISGFVESRDPEDRGSLFAQLGLHNRGSSVGLFGFRSRRNYNFKNISLLLGAKKAVDTELLGAKPYYFLGIRGEYTLAHNLVEMFEFFENILFNNPQIMNAGSLLVEPAFVRRWNYGISIGGGFEFSGTEFFNPALEFTISPDLSYQYQRFPNSISPFETQVRNVSFEISLVLRFLREIVYE